MSFENFLRFVLLNTENCNSAIKTCAFLPDLHWRPYYQQCGFCDLSYDFIGRLETFHQDWMRLTELTEFTTVAQNSIEVMHNTTNRQDPIVLDAQGYIQASGLTKEYFKNVSMDISKKIYLIYELDFMMFQYSVSGIFLQ